MRGEVYLWSVIKQSDAHTEWYTTLTAKRLSWRIVFLFGVWCLRGLCCELLCTTLLVDLHVRSQSVRINGTFESRALSGIQMWHNWISWSWLKLLSFSSSFISSSFGAKAFSMLEALLSRDVISSIPLTPMIYYHLRWYLQSRFVRDPSNLRASQVAFRVPIARILALFVRRGEAHRLYTRSRTGTSVLAVRSH